MKMGKGKNLIFKIGHIQKWMDRSLTENVKWNRWKLENGITAGNPYANYFFWERSIRLTKLNQNNPETNLFFSVVVAHTKTGSHVLIFYRNFVSHLIIINGIDLDPFPHVMWVI